MKKAIITGGTGCLGRNLIDVLGADGWDITVLHRESSDLSKLKDCDVKTVLVDFRDKKSLENAVQEGTDAIFHVAANLSHDPKDEDEQWLDNVLSTRHLAEVAVNKKVKKFIFTSTGATIQFNSNGEEACDKIKSGYIRTKRLAELELYKFISQDLDFVILHPIIVIGKYDYNNYSTIFKYLKQGKLSRIFDGSFTFCDAEKIAEAHLSAFYKGKKNEHYLLGGVFSTWVELSNTAAKKLKIKSKTKPIPYPVLKFVSHIVYIYSKIMHKKPHLTPQVAELVGRGYPKFNDYLISKSKVDLGYNTDEQTMEKMVGSCINWMQLAGKF